MFNDTISYGHYMTIKSKRPYGFKTENKDFVINEFHQLGWPDPFPGDQLV